MKPIYSIYTETLQELLSLSKRVDTATATNTDFINIQRLQCAIIDRYKANYYGQKEYDILKNIGWKLYQDIKQVIRLNESIRTLEKGV